MSTLKKAKRKMAPAKGFKKAVKTAPPELQNKYAVSLYERDGKMYLSMTGPTAHAAFLEFCNADLSTPEGEAKK